MSGEYLRLKSFEMKQAKQTVRMVMMMELEDTQHRSMERHTVKEVLAPGVH